MGSVNKKVEANPREIIGHNTTTTGAQIHCQNKANAAAARVTRKGLLGAKSRQHDAIRIIPGKRTTWSYTACAGTTAMVVSASRRLMVNRKSRESAGAKRICQERANALTRMAVIKIGPSSRPA
jgi:hypothetical protein